MMGAPKIGLQERGLEVMNLFTYGTLMFPEVMEAVIGKPCESVGAVLKGYRRVRVLGRPYPGIYACGDHETCGRLYTGLNEGSLTLLDRFEGSLYERRHVTVKTTRQGSVDTSTYVIADGNTRVLSSDPWDADRFKAEWFEPYLQACHDFRFRYQDGASDNH